MRTLPILRPHTGKHAAGTIPVQPFPRREPSPTPVSREVRQHEQHDAALLRRVRDGLLNLDAPAADPITEARTLLHTAESLDWPDAGPAAAALGGALEIHDATDRDELPGDAEPDPGALDQATARVRLAAGDLRKAMSDHCRNKTTSTTGAEA